MFRLLDALDCSGVTPVRFHHVVTTFRTNGQVTLPLPNLEIFAIYAPGIRRVPVE